MRCQGREVRSWMDYIRGADSRLIRKVSVREPRKNLDYFMVLGCLLRMGVNQLHRATPEAPSMPLETKDSVAPVVRRPAAGYSQTASLGMPVERVDFGQDMETCG